jgi:hypothetical protein
VKFVCLVYGEEDLMATVPDAECMANGLALKSSGQYVAAEALRPVRDAVTVRVRNGAMSVIDGPFAETKEQLAGFYLIDATDMNEAVQIASRIPPARIGSIEVRPVRELSV